MADFYINTELMKKPISEFDVMLSELRSIQAELEMVDLSALGFSSCNSIQNTLKEHREALKDSIESVQSMAEALNIIVRLYRTTDENVQNKLGNNIQTNITGNNNNIQTKITGNNNIVQKTAFYTGNSQSVFSSIKGTTGMIGVKSNPEVKDNELIDVSVFGENNEFVYITSDGAPWVFHQGKQEPERPKFDQGYPYDPNLEATWSDRFNWIKWGIISGGADFLEYLPDGVEAYNHYRNGDGSDLEINLPKAYNQDSNIKQNTDNAVGETNRAVQQMIANGVHPPFTITSECKAAGSYPSTENWQKAVGGYQTWVSADISYDDHGNVVVVTTVHEWDRYNFDKGKADITTQEPDDVNGRFEALGWAHSFDTYGSVTFTTIIDPNNEIGVPEISPSDRGNRAGYERREGR